MLFTRGLLDIFFFSELQKSRLMLYKTNNECFSFMHLVKDEMFYSTREMKCSIQLGKLLSPRENICTIALITIHYLYTIQLVALFETDVSSKALKTL